MNWAASYASSFEKDLTGLRPDLRQKAIQQLKDILVSPFRGKKLKGSRHRYSVRISRDYRIVYSIYRTERLIDFEFVGDRKQAYRWLRHE